MDEGNEMPKVWATLGLGAILMMGALLYSEIDFGTVLLLMGLLTVFHVTLMLLATIQLSLFVELELGALKDAIVKFTAMYLMTQGVFLVIELTCFLPIGGSPVRFTLVFWLLTMFFLTKAFFDVNTPLAVGMVCL